MHKCVLSHLRWCHLKATLTTEVTEAGCVLGLVEQNFVSEVQKGHINIGLNQHCEWE